MVGRTLRAIDPERSAGVNVIGYHCTASGVGVAARSVTACLRAAGVPTSVIDIEPTLSPRLGPPPEVDQLYATTIVVGTAERMAQVHELFADVLDGSRRVVGYWFWELDAIADTDRYALDMVDEVWTATRFVADAFRAATDLPVRVMPFYLAPPSLLPRRPRATSVEPVTLLNSFDYLSVIERKNPLDLIDAFRRAIDDDRARLVLKTLNAQVVPESASRLAEAIGDDARISVVDGYLDDEAHARLMAQADCFVSLHRSEGLGLHLAEAMWLGVPVIATNYSGNVDFMDPTNSALVDYRLTQIASGTRSYPPGARWAQPDLDDAAAWITRIVDDPALRRRLGAAGRRAMRSQPTAAERGRAMAQHVELPGTPRRGPRQMLRDAARAATAPVRNYVNGHFEMTKQEVREQAASLRDERVERAALDHAAFDRLTDVNAEASQHQTQALAALRRDFADLRDEVRELRDAIDTLSQAIADLVQETNTEGL